MVLGCNEGFERICRKIRKSLIAAFHVKGTNRGPYQNLVNVKMTGTQFEVQTDLNDFILANQRFQNNQVTNKRTIQSIKGIPELPFKLSNPVCLSSHFSSFLFDSFCFLFFKRLVR